MGKRTMMAGPIYVEDAASGPILIEKYPSIVEALPHQWTMEGKDLRAYAVQQYFNGGRVRITEACYAKTVSFKGVRVNHLWTQLNAFVLGDKEASKRADDLLDAAVYAASVSFRPRPVNK
jgi:Terminase RNaseH-like domain